MTPAQTYEFDTATQVAPGGAATIVSGWDINGNANGGYLMALAGRAMRDAAGRPDPISVTAHYLAPGRPGPVQVDSTVVKAGRRFATVSAQLRSGDKPIMQLVGAFGDLASTESFEHVTSVPPDLPPFEECPLRERQQGTAEVALNDRTEVRLHPDHLGWLRGERSGSAEMAGWFAFRDGRPLDTLALLMVCDAFPPAVFHLDMPPGWPTLRTGWPQNTGCRCWTVSPARSSWPRRWWVWASGPRALAAMPRLRSRSCARRADLPGRPIPVHPVAARRRFAAFPFPPRLRSALVGTRAGRGKR